MPSVGPFNTEPEPGTNSRVTSAILAIREAIGGDKRAAIRRIILWTLVVVLVAGAAPAWIVLLPVALLMATDGLL
jgi:hypothetical protein